MIGASQNGHSLAGFEALRVGQRRALDGATFILDRPPSATPVWGEGDQVAWAVGEHCMLCGPPGVGKSTLAQRLVLARTGIRPGAVLGMPVAVDERPVLYFAGDRPAQIARSFARMVGEDDRALLAERLLLWGGPLDFTVTKEPAALVAFALAHGAGTLVIDSLKDLASGLSEDFVGAQINAALQRCVVEGVEVLDLHHLRKASGDNPRPNKLDDVYGSFMLTAGAGSVLLLWGEAGDPVVDLRHLKPPVTEIGPLTVTHDHAGGVVSVAGGVDLLDLARDAGAVGLEVRSAAAAFYGTAKPTPAQVERIRRRLDTLVAQQTLVQLPRSRATDSARYRLATPTLGLFA